MKIDLQHLDAEFQALYRQKPRFFRAPGRVNLIGEHTDYNGGFVLPMAIESETVVAAAAREDRKICVRSVNLEQEGEINLNAPEQTFRDSWLDYVEGMARVLERGDVKLCGANLLIASSVPAGAGLSSSAALEISTGLALSEVCGITVDKISLARAGQTAEHDFVGAKVGIMDQFISALGKKNHALLIDCRSLDAKHVSLKTDDAAVVICNSKIKHNLSSSEYNVRRAECETGVEMLRKFLPDITQLRDVNFAEFNRYKEHLPEIIEKRCRHVITEIERTLSAAQALEQSDLTKFGELMNSSHKSLRDDYEVSCRELDLLVEIASGCDYVLGARMTGGGFGGSTVNLVERTKLDEFRQEVSTKYRNETGISPDIHVSDPADGASEVTFGRG